MMNNSKKSPILIEKSVRMYYFSVFSFSDPQGIEKKQMETRKFYKTVFVLVCLPTVQLQLKICLFHISNLLKPLKII